MFEHNFVLLLQQDICLKDLLNSDIFNHRFEFYEWPAIHTDAKDLICPYNGSIFNLRQNYKEVFGEFVESNTLGRKKPNFGGFKEIQIVNKIKYTLNILPSMSEKMATLMEGLGETEELEVFDTKSVMDMIDFKWRKYAS